jgi:hypothetical protein
VRGCCGRPWIGAASGPSPCAGTFGSREKDLTHCTAGWARADDRGEEKRHIGNEDIDVAHKLAEAVTAAAARQALTVAPDIDVQADIIIGHATAGLMKMADIGAPNIPTYRSAPY